MLSMRSGFDVCEQACSRTIQTSGADCFMRGSASPSMRERRINGVMMPYIRGKLQVQLDPGFYPQITQIGL